MEKNNEILREKLFDGKEEDMIITSFSIANISIKISQIMDNQFRNLIQDKKIRLEDFEKIVEDENFEKKGLLIKNYFKGNLEVYYLINDGKIYLFSFGEFQPTRFILYFEGVYFL